MIIIGIDPGPTSSGVVHFDTETKRVVKTVGEMPTEELLDVLRGDMRADVIACEVIEAMYAHVGAETVQTIIYVGRIMEIAHHRQVGLMELTSQHVKKVICNSHQAKDPAVRQALIDRFGGEAVALAKRKTCPECNGRTILNIRIPCPECGETGEVPGAKEGKTKKCPTCKGRTDIADTALCGCDGKVGVEGPLVGVSSHAWRALAVAVAADMIGSGEAISPKKKQ